MQPCFLPFGNLEFYYSGDEVHSALIRRQPGSALLKQLLAWHSSSVVHSFIFYIRNLAAIPIGMLLLFRPKAANRKMPRKTGGKMWSPNGFWLLETRISLNCWWKMIAVLWSNNLNIPLGHIPKFLACFPLSSLTQTFHWLSLLLLTQTWYKTCLNRC